MYLQLSIQDWWDKTKIKLLPDRVKAYKEKVKQTPVRSGPPVFPVSDRFLKKNASEDECRTQNVDTKWLCIYVSFDGSHLVQMRQETIKTVSYDNKIPRKPGQKSYI